MSIVKTVKKIIYGNIPYFHYRFFKPDSPKTEYYKFMKDNGYTHFPYDYAQNYIKMQVNIIDDQEKGLKYVIHKQNKKLYFPSDLPNEKIVKIYKSLLIEQDVNSPHHYVDSHDEFKDKIILDIGSAEGLTSLEAVETAGFIYLFECKKEWIKALHATFEPWKEKIGIIPKFVSNKNSDDTITIDDFLKDKPKDNLFVKMDIEGEERYALQGAEKLFSSNPGTQFAICTYHKKDDEKVISSYLDKYQCIYSVRNGYLYYKHHLRTCLIRGYTK